VCVCVCVRERERERERVTFVCACAMFVFRVCVHSAMLVGGGQVPGGLQILPTGVTGGGQVPGGLQILPTGVTFFVLCVVCVVCVCIFLARCIIILRVLGRDLEGKQKAEGRDLRDVTLTVIVFFLIFFNFAASEGDRMSSS
jgi:hypothetical protein